MQAIVLVGGKGTRLRPLTYATPKPMIPILGVPFLARTLEKLREAGVRDVILPAGYLPQAIVDYFGDGSRFGVNLTYVIEDEPLGTAGALKNVQHYIDGPFLVLNGDILTSLDLSSMIAEHKRLGGIGLLHLITVDDPSAFGVVVHDAEGRILEFVEKPPKESAPSHDVNAGTYLFEPRILDMIPAGRNVSIEQETFPKVVGTDHLYEFTTTDYWMDLGSPEHYLTAHADILARRMPLAEVPQAVNVYVDPSANVDTSAELGSNVVVGAGSTIGSHAIIRNSVLWDNVTIEEDAHVEGAILASGSIIGAGARVGDDSVVGHYTAIAAPGLERHSRVWAVPR
jgi:mannose-1-phosphate guanylyltransferase